MGEQLLVLFEGARGDVMKEMFGIDDADDEDDSATAPAASPSASKGRWEQRLPSATPSSRPGSRSGSVSGPSGPGSGPSGAAARTSVSSLFSQSLSDLLTSIGSTHSHFVRCIKPNSDKLSLTSDTALLLTQLTTSGIIDAVRVRKDGYSERMAIPAFLRAYQPLVSATLKQRGMQRASDRAKVEVVMDSVPGALEGKGWQLGKTKVFYKGHVHLALEGRRRARKTAAAVVVQRLVRGWLVRRKQKAVRQQWRDLNNSLQAGQLAPVDALLTQAKASGALPAALLASAQKQRNLLSSGNNATKALTQALTLPASSLVDRLKLLDTASGARSKARPAAVRHVVADPATPAESGRAGGEGTERPPRAAQRLEGRRQQRRTAGRRAQRSGRGAHGRRRRLRGGRRCAEEPHGAQRGVLGAREGHPDAAGHQ